MLELIVSKSGIEQHNSYVTKQALESELELISRSITQKFQFYTEQFFSKFEF